MVTPLGPGAEFDRIRAFLAGVRTDVPGVRVGPGDDCAVVTGDGIAVTVDMSVEDVHFRRAWVSAADIGYHVAAGALSDLAAVAARPIGVFASLALGPNDAGTARDQGIRGGGFGQELMGGIRAAASDAGAVVLGGDLTRSPGPLVVDIVAVGEVGTETRRGDRPGAVLRSGARPGDEVWVTGTLGAAAAAVEAWLAGGEPAPYARSAWTRPESRTREALWLAERGVPTAMVDLSDGIAGDAGHIAAASNVRVVIRGASLPVPEPGTVSGSALPDAIRRAAAGGEDYELCLTAQPGAVDEVRAEFVDAFGVRLTRVGTVEEGTGAVVVDEEGKSMELRAFQHWSDT